MALVRTLQTWALLPTPVVFWTLRQAISKVDIQECRVVEITSYVGSRPGVLVTPGDGFLRNCSLVGAIRCVLSMPQ